MTGSTVTYKNLWLNNNGGAAELNPSVEGDQVLASTGGSETFINNTDTTGVGYGQYDLNFGTASDASGASSVELFIPVTTAKKGDYKAVITWTLQSVQ